MRTLHVGGINPLNRHKTLESALSAAYDDDIIEIHKDLKDVSTVVDRNITIKGNNHTIIPAPGSTALTCASFVTMKDLKFECLPRTNAVIIHAGGELVNVTTKIKGPARALYSTIIQDGGGLGLTSCDVMNIETVCPEGKMPTIYLDCCMVRDYYDGAVCFNDNDYSKSKLRGRTSIDSSCLMSCLLAGECSLKDTTLYNFNKATGTVVMDSCSLEAYYGEQKKYRNEPKDGPLKNAAFDVIPHALYIAGGEVFARHLTSKTEEDAVGFYMASGSLSISDSDIHDTNVRHVIENGSLAFTNVMDEGFYEVIKATCSAVNSNVNTSKAMKTAMEKLDEMIGLDSVKKQLKAAVNTIRINMEHPEKDFGFSRHMVFAGDPGTGKTTAADLVAQALFEIGAIRENRCMHVPASQMIKGWVGQTGEHVENIMKQALGGVLFIDEAYELMVKDGQNTFNNDALAVLLRYMEDNRDDLVVIAAGYEKEMREFLASNVGLTRRFQWVTFENYTPSEMADIFLSMAGKYSEQVEIVDAHMVLTGTFDLLTGFYLSHPDSKGRVTNGGNGGLVRNLFQQAVTARNNRITDDPGTTMGITREDLDAGYEEEMRKARQVQL